MHLPMHLPMNLPMNLPMYLRMILPTRRPIAAVETAPSRSTKRKRPDERAPSPTAGCNAPRA